MSIRPSPSRSLSTTGETGMRLFTRVCSMVISPFVDLELRPAVEYAHLGPAVFAANHRSMADFVIGMATFHRLGIFPRIMIATDWLRGPLGLLGRSMGVIPVDRSQGAEQSVHAAVDAVGAGARLMIMPEGKLHWDPENPLQTGRGRPGMIRVARQAGVPIVPVSVDGTEVLWPKGRALPRLRPFRRQRVIVTLGELVSVQSTGPDADIADAERIMTMIRALLAESARSREDTTDDGGL